MKNLPTSPLVVGTVVLELKILASSCTHQMETVEIQRKCKFVTWRRPSGHKVVFVLCWPKCVPEHLFPKVLLGKVVAELSGLRFDSHYLLFLETVVKEPIQYSEKHPE